MPAVRRPRLTPVALSLLLVAGACNPFGGDDDPPPTTAPPPPTQPPSRVGASIDGTLTIGALLPLSGELELFGPGMRAAVEQAVDEVNDAGGVLGEDVVLVVEDTASVAEQAGDAAARLVDDPLADALIGPASSLELFGGVVEQAQEAERVVCSPTASSPRLGTADPKGLVFSATPNRIDEVQPLASTLAADGDGRVAVVRRDGPDEAALMDAFVRELAGAFGADGFEVVADVVVPPQGAPAAGDPAPAPDGAPTEGAAGPEAAVDEVARARPEAVVLLMLPGEAAPILRAMFEAELLPSAGNADVAVWVNDTLVSSQLANAVDPDRPTILDGVRGVRPAVDTRDTAGFDERLKARRAVDEVAQAAEAYDCTIITALAALQAGTDDPARLATEMLAVTRGGSDCADFVACSSLAAAGEDIRYTGVLGLEWNDVGEPTQGVFDVVRFVDGGRLEVASTVTVPARPPVPPAADAPATTTTIPATGGAAPPTTTTTGARSTTSAAPPSTLAGTNGS